MIDKLKEIITPDPDVVIFPSGNRDNCEIILEEKAPDANQTFAFKFGYPREKDQQLFKQLV